MTTYIATRYLGETNTLPSRIQARTEQDRRFRHTRSVGIEDATHEVSHAEAAKALIHKLGWWGLWIAGAGAHGNAYVRFNADYEGNLKEGMGKEGEDWFYVRP